VSTTDPDRVTVWLGAAGATDLTRRDAEDLAALLLRAVRQLGGCPGLYGGPGARAGPDPGTRYGGAGHLPTFCTGGRHG
jgi:hypothetical protein